MQWKPKWKEVNVMARWEHETEDEVKYTYEDEIVYISVFNTDDFGNGQWEYVNKIVGVKFNYESEFIEWAEKQ